jgi:predicted XRE-type DNA-binding protein
MFKALSTRVAVLLTALCLSFAGLSVSTVHAQTPNPSQQARIVNLVLRATLDAVEKAAKLNRQTLLKEIASGKTLNEIVTAKGADPTAVKAAAKTSITDELKKLTEQGELSEAQSKLLLSLIDPTLNALFERKFNTSKETVEERRVRLSSYNLLIQETSKATKISQRELLLELREGTTLAQIAKEKSADTDAIVNEVVTRVTAQINQRVKGGNLKQEEADRLIGGLKDQVTGLMNGPAPFMNIESRLQDRLKNLTDSDKNKKQPTAQPTAQATLQPTPAR